MTAPPPTLRTHPDLEPAFLEAASFCKPYTMMSLERMYGLWQACEYVVRCEVEGDIVECGVWKGGGAMLLALGLQFFGDEDRRIWVYDTFTGMTRPTEHDVDIRGTAMADGWDARKESLEIRYGNPSADEAAANVGSTGFAADRLVLVQGPVEETIPARAPGSISLLHLDTDWYESTRHELEHLYPALSPRGVLAIDDYGHFRGCRRAVDEYIAAHGLPLLLQRVDYTGRMAIKP